VIPEPAQVEHLSRLAKTTLAHFAAALVTKKNAFSPLTPSGNVIDNFNDKKASA
jgi:hypothetical protein